MRRKLLAVAVPVAACMFWGNVLAQPLEEIVVEASPIVKEGKADTASPAPGYYKVLMSSRVSYADLDLAKPADVATLDSRIIAAAPCSRGIDGRPARDACTGPFIEFVMSAVCEDEQSTNGSATIAGCCPKGIRGRP